VAEKTPEVTRALQKKCILEKSYVELASNCDFIAHTSLSNHQDYVLP
jgi:hypothetical protein